MRFLHALAAYAHTDRTAIRYGGDSLSYAALEDRSNAFASYLLDRFGADRSPVLIYGHKELSIPVCMFGALKAGRSYIPVDTTFPEERVRQITEEVQPRCIVDLRGLELSAEEVLSPDKLEGILSRPAQPVPSENWLQPEQTAYILFTSGSTGRPKGVQITAGNIEAFLEGVAPWFEIREAEGAFLNEISYSFDVSVCALYYALGRGMTLYTLDRDTLHDPRRLFEALSGSEIHTWVSTPSLAELCVQSERFEKAQLPKIRLFVFCGEVFTRKLALQMAERFPGVRVLNAYGPTETTVLVTAAEVTEEIRSSDRPVPIGYPFDNVRAVIADENGDPVPDGTAGELLILGPCVSPGYYNRPALNEAAFFTDRETGLRGYHTGDLCYRENGCIYYCGRLDGQVKLNGYRVELEDVENNLSRLENVARAAVVPVMTDGKVTSLTAFLMLESPDGLSSLKRSQKLRSLLSEILPDYMIPRRFVTVDAFPLNTNGKIDKKALAAML